VTIPDHILSRKLLCERLEKMTAHVDAPQPFEEAYIAVELGTNANEQARKHARAALDLAVGLEHKRSATWRDAAMCPGATASVVRLLAIVEGRRDPG
jgi:hypothetical protein